MHDKDFIPLLHLISKCLNWRVTTIRRPVLNAYCDDSLPDTLFSTHYTITTYYNQSNILWKMLNLKTIYLYSNCTCTILLLESLVDISEQNVTMIWWRVNCTTAAAKNMSVRICQWHRSRGYGCMHEPHGLESWQYKQAFNRAPRERAETHRQRADWIRCWLLEGSQRISIRFQLHSAQ